MSVFPKDELFDITLGIVNAHQSHEVVTAADLDFYRAECAGILERLPHSMALEEILDLRHLYPMFYFLPFVFARGVKIDRDVIRQAALACSLCTRKVMIVDWCADGQLTQLRYRGLAHFDEAHLGYYVQHLDDSFHEITSRLFPADHRFWDYYRRLLRAYLGAMLDEPVRNRDVMLSPNPIVSTRLHCLQKSVLMRLCGSVVTLLEKDTSPTRLSVYEELIDALILLLTTIDDASDYVEDVRTGQASELASFLTDGTAVSDFDENTEKALIIKYYLGGGLDFVRRRLDEQFQGLFELTSRHEGVVPLSAWNTCLRNLQATCDDGLLGDEHARARVTRLLFASTTAT